MTFNRLRAGLLASVFLLSATPALAQVMNGPMAAQNPVSDGRRLSQDNYDVDNNNDVVDILPDEGSARGIIVTERVRPEYQPQGTKAGSFRFLPEVTLKEMYNDNIYATRNNEESDFITIVEPRLALRSDWNKHSLNFLAASGHGFYTDNSDENYTDYLLQTDGRLDVTRNTRLAALASYSKNHEERGSPNDVATQKEPVEFYVRTLQGEIFHKLNRMKFNVIYSNQDFQYDNSSTRAGVLVDNEIRDRVDNEITGRVAYEISANQDVYLQGAYVNRDYNNRSNRDSDGYSLYGGLRSDISGKLFGDVYAGYIHHEYDNASFGDYDGFGFGMNGYWNVTGLTTLTGNIGRDIQETIVGGASGYVQSRARVNLDHELRRNIILSGVVGYNNDDYRGINREDDVWTLGLGAKYLLNSHFHFFGNYNFITRDSSTNANDYDQNRFLIGVRAAL
jgi:hypothetical protein